MISVGQLYKILNEKIPPSLSCEWDNDGLMCCPDPDVPVRGVLLALDITERMMERAIKENCNVILSHHPLVFRPVKALNTEEGTPRKLIKLVKNEISAISFHTRLDALTGGVNDVLANLIGLENSMPFGEGAEKMGRVGDFPTSALEEFAAHVKKKLGSPFVLYCGNRTVKRVAVLGGNGDDDISAAKAAGADTYVSGRLGYHPLSAAIEDGINLIEAGHFYTENPVLPFLASLVKNADPTIPTIITDSCEIHSL